MFGIPQPPQSTNYQSGVLRHMVTGKMYALKQSILNILYKDIIEDIEQEKSFMAKVSL
jgi:hypothetical protein